MRETWPPEPVAAEAEPCHDVGQRHKGFRIGNGGENGYDDKRERHIQIRTDRIVQSVLLDKSRKEHWREDDLDN